MVKRLLNKLGRTKSEFLFNYFPTTLDFVKSKNNKILMYHGVDAIGSTKFNSRHTAVANFEKQIRFLKKNCNIISLEDYFLRKFDETKPNIAITFDDGYLNNYIFAKPILEQYKAKATFFITGLNEIEDDILWADFLDIVSKFITSDFKFRGEIFRMVNGSIYNENYISLYEIIKNNSYEYKRELYKVLKDYSNFKENDEFSNYWKLMNDEQIKETANSDIISIGSHGYYHNNLGRIPLPQAVEELKKSKFYLENLIQKEINSIGYPDGSYTRNLISESIALGFKYQLATDSYLFEEDENDQRILTRKGIYSCDSCGNQLIY